MGIDKPLVDQRVRVQARPKLVGTIVEVVNDGYVVVKFDDIADQIGCSTERLVLHP